MNQLPTEKGKDMSETYSGFGLGDAVVNAAMSNGFNNRGAGWNGGGGVYPVGQFAGLNTIQHGIGDAKDCIRAGNTNLQREFSFNHQNDLMFAQSNQMGQNMLSLTGQHWSAQLTTQQGFAAQMLEFCKCCKDGQIEAIKEANKTRELVIADGTKTRELFLTTKLSEAVDKNNINATVGPITQAMAAQTQVLADAINNIGHHGPH